MRVKKKDVPQTKDIVNPRLAAGGIAPQSTDPHVRKAQDLADNATPANEVKGTQNKIQFCFTIPKGRILYRLALYAIQWDSYVVPKRMEWKDYPVAVSEQITDYQCYVEFEVHDSSSPFARWAIGWDDITNVHNEPVLLE